MQRFKNMHKSQYSTRQTRAYHTNKGAKLDAKISAKMDREFKDMLLRISKMDGELKDLFRHTYRPQ